MNYFDITFPDGRTVRVTARPVPIGEPIMTVRRGDQVVAEGQLREVGDVERAHRGWSDRVTHAIGHVPIAAEYVDRVRGIEAVPVARRATPEGAAGALREQRHRLVRELSAAADMAAQARADAFDCGVLDTHLAPGGPGEDRERRVQQAQDALDAFDRAHPEIKQAMKAKRDADVRRWADL